MIVAGIMQTLCTCGKLKNLIRVSILSQGILLHFTFILKYAYLMKTFMHLKQLKTDRIEIEKLY